MITKGFAVLVEQFTPRIACFGPPVPGCGWTLGTFHETILGRGRWVEVPIRTALGRSSYYERISNAKDTIFVVDRGQPMAIRREKGGAVANVTLGYSAQSARGIAPLFR